MKVGLTGGTGFIGQYLIRDFGKKIDFVVLTSNDNCSDFSSNAKYIHSDYSIEDMINSFEDCDAVVNLGGYVQQGSENLTSFKPYQNNIDIANNVFLSCRELGIKNIVNASSVAVYRQDETHPLKESDLCEPNSTYGISKIAIEHLANIFNHTYDMKIKSLRFAQVLGNNKKLQGFYKMLLYNASHDLPITVYGKGIAGRDLLYVKDAARAIISALKQPNKVGAYNIGQGKIITNVELAYAFWHGFGSKGGVEFIDVDNEDSHRWCIDIEKAEKELLFSPIFDIKKMSEDIRNEYYLK